MDEFEIMKAANKELQRLARTTHPIVYHLGVFDSEMVTIGWMV
jgi:DNA-binding IclR family transcriptional regulator